MMSVRGDLSQVLDGSGQGGGRGVGRRRRKTGHAKSTMRDMRQQARISIGLCPIIQETPFILCVCLQGKQIAIWLISVSVCRSKSKKLGDPNEGGHPDSKALYKHVLDTLPSPETANLDAAGCVFNDGWPRRNPCTNMADREKTWFANSLCLSLQQPRKD